MRGEEERSNVTTTAARAISKEVRVAERKWDEKNKCDWRMTYEGLKRLIRDTAG